MNASFGIEGMTDEDRGYGGSRFSIVKEALFANPYQKIWGDPSERPLPVHTVPLDNVLHGIWSFGRNYLFKKATERAVDSFADLRWGPDRKGFRRLVHPNGICLTGVWEITADTAYSGYFRKGSRGLIVGRYSTCCTEPRRGHSRSLSLVGKIFPTMDANHLEPLRPAHFFTQQDIGGDTTDYINDVELRNAPNTTSWRRGSGLPILIITGIVFRLVDKNPSIRQLYQIAELQKAPDQKTAAPTFLRLVVAADQPRIDGENLDFRDEIMAQIYDRGDAAPKRALVFNIETTDEGETHGLPAFERRTFRNWRQIGRITFNSAVISYNGDFVIHFHHPAWRDDQNNPSTAVRPSARPL